MPATCSGDTPGGNGKPSLLGRGPRGAAPVTQAWAAEDLQAVAQPEWSHPWSCIEPPTHGTRRAQGNWPKVTQWLLGFLDQLQVCEGLEGTQVFVQTKAPWTPWKAP